MHFTAGAESNLKDAAGILSPTKLCDDVSKVHLEKEISVQ